MIFWLTKYDISYDLTLLTVRQKDLLSLHSFGNSFNLSLRGKYASKQSPPLFLFLFLSSLQRNVGTKKEQEERGRLRT